MACSPQDRILSLLAYLLPSKELRSPVVPLAVDVATKIEADVKRQNAERLMQAVREGRYPKGVIGTEVKQVLAYFAKEFEDAGNQKHCP